MSSFYLLTFYPQAILLFSPFFFNADREKSRVFHGFPRLGKLSSRRTGLPMRLLWYNDFRLA
jgi:hypothetical protein